MSQSDSAVFDPVAIRKNWNPEKDKYKIKEDDNKFDRIAFGVFKYEHSRKLNVALARKATDYIRACVQRYPFSLRYEMALPLWDRFSQEWCDTGDETRALGAI